ncbi:alpha-2,8-sialyltransferase 8B-like isoform X3 [Branchiostoma floridae]|uniref:Alpha-2,8-sialyltransferase 8B-like isoform X3 n=1 Tax=Branchiostoma floridae TaxID=7739 RepID=A0A9J7L917_BRAFL|nr:alpha-2,8-sialyltransferase 8B-like isoform X3 [Branchiostoma floridae]
MGISDSGSIVCSYVRTGKSHRRAGPVTRVNTTVLCRGRKHFIMGLKECNTSRIFKSCNTSRMFKSMMVLFFVLPLVMLFLTRYELSTNAEPRLHTKNAGSDFRETPQRVEKPTANDTIVPATSGRPNDTGNVQGDSTNQTSVQNNTAQVLGPGIHAAKNNTKWRFNSTEVQKMRQHILKFYNPETNLTLRKSGIRIGQQLKYEMKWGNKTSLNVTKNFFMLIPEESPLKDRHFNTCTVVGNSGILLNSSCGQEIDSMDFVIRCNLPQIEGYEKDVGSKANLTTMNPSVIGQHFGQWENKTADDYDRLIRRLEQIGDQILYVPTLASWVGYQWSLDKGWV